MTKITNPCIPLVMTVAGGSLTAGTILTITGEPLHRCIRFNVSLVCGPQPDKADIAFQLNPRFDVEWVVRNSKVKKQWGTEEATATTAFPFHDLEPFQLEIFVSPSSYLVAINGQHYCEYTHRVPFSEVDTLQVQGDLRLKLVEFKHTDHYPIQPAPNLLNIINPSLPFFSILNGAFELGNEIQFHGKVKPQPNRFHLNLQHGCQVYPHPDIALHINPRFEYGNRSVVLNSFYDNSWGQEQVIGANNPFKPNSDFVLGIRQEATHFQILVNGVRLTNFNYRILASLIDSVVIDGDVTISKVVVI